MVVYGINLVQIGCLVYVSALKKKKNKKLWIAWIFGNIGWLLPALGKQLFTAGPSILLLSRQVDIIFHASSWQKPRKRWVLEGQWGRNDEPPSPGLLVRETYRWYKWPSSPMREWASKTTGLGDKEDGVEGPPLLSTSESQLATEHSHQERLEPTEKDILHPKTLITSFRWESHSQSFMSRKYRVPINGNDGLIPILRYWMLYTSPRQSLALLHWYNCLT